MSSPAPLPKEIHRSAERGELQKVVKWLRKGGGVDAFFPLTFNDGRTTAEPLLHAAAGWGHLAMVRELLKRGASVDLPSSLGGTALMAAAIRGDLSTLRFLLQHSADPEGEYTVDLSTLRTVRQGGDVTIYCYGAMVPVVERAAAQAAEQRGIDCLVVDLRTLMPLDEEGVLEAAKQTGRVVVVHEAPRFCGYGAEISALIAEHCIEYMEAPVRRVTGFDTPFPNILS